MFALRSVLRKWWRWRPMQIDKIQMHIVCVFASANLSLPLFRSPSVRCVHLKRLFIFETCKFWHFYNDHRRINLMKLWSLWNGREKKDRKSTAQAGKKVRRDSFFLSIDGHWEWKKCVMLGTYIWCLCVVVCFHVHARTVLVRQSLNISVWANHREETRALFPSSQLLPFNAVFWLSLVICIFSSRCVQEMNFIFNPLEFFSSCLF